ncbi:MAG: InlB B-repeat-containing protein, partial [Candidatus Taylorbacteria bacterium]|nr:InlB B-repeat-containing protein [Candidatus Taylorbacteria bacterium]
MKSKERGFIFSIITLIVVFLVIIGGIYFYINKNIQSNQKTNYGAVVENSLAYYTLTYSANNGTGAPSPISSTAGSVIILSTTTPTRTGYVFSSWNTSSYGSGTNYLAGASYTMPSASVTLYAKWSVAYSVTYSANGGIGSVPVDANKYASGKIVTVLGNTGNLTKTGYVFNGWNTSSYGSGTNRAVGSTFTITANVTLYAKWITIPTLTYSANGGSGAPVAEKRLPGSVLALSNTIPTKTGYVFNGWNTSSYGSGTNYASGASYTMPSASVTLYAKWSVAY